LYNSQLTTALAGSLVRRDRKLEGEEKEVEKKQVDEVKEVCIIDGLS
jgi:hypothetical protein